MLEIWQNDCLPNRVSLSASRVGVRKVAGFKVPDSPLITRAIAYGYCKLERHLFNHAVRSWLFAVRTGENEGTVYDGEVVALAILLHALGLMEQFASSDRFEVASANAARSLALGYGVERQRAQLIWDCVALHTTPSIAKYKQPEVALSCAGIAADFVGVEGTLVREDELTQILVAFPRLSLKQRLSRRFCELARARPESTYDNFLRDFGDRFVPGYRSSSSVDLLLHAPFDE